VIAVSREGTIPSSTDAIRAFETFEATFRIDVEQTYRSAALWAENDRLGKDRENLSFRA